MARLLSCRFLRPLRRVARLSLRRFKVVAVVLSKRGGKESHRFVDIANGLSEFHFGRTTTRYDGTLLVGPTVPAHGFEVHESVNAALAATYPSEVPSIENWTRTPSDAPRASSDTLFRCSSLL